MPGERELAKPWVVGLNCGLCGGETPAPLPLPAVLPVQAKTVRRAGRTGTLWCAAATAADAMFFCSAARYRLMCCDIIDWTTDESSIEAVRISWKVAEQKTLPTERFHPKVAPAAAASADPSCLAS